MSRRGFIDRDTGTVFFWSQKSGCTSLFSMLSRNYGKSNQYYHKGSVDFLGAQEEIGRHGYRSVVIKRDPIDRAISAYINKFVFRKKPLLSPADLEPFSVKLHKAYCALFDKDVEENSITFAQFLETVGSMLQRRRDPNDNSSVNGHWDTQVPPAALNFKYGRVFDISEVSTGFRDYCKDIGLSFDVPQMNKTQYSEHGSYLVDVPAFELAKANVSLSKKSFRSEETDRLIRYMYAIDYIKFPE